MYLNFLREVFQTHSDADAMIWNDQSFSYGWLLDAMQQWRERLEKDAVAHGTFVTDTLHGERFKKMRAEG